MNPGWNVGGIVPSVNTTSIFSVNYSYLTCPWARIWMPKPALFVTHIDQLKHLRADYHKSIIFDDMHFNGDENGKGAWPRTSQIAIVDRENGRRCFN